MSKKKATSNKKYEDDISHCSEEEKGISSDHEDLENQDNLLQSWSNAKMTIQMLHKSSKQNGYTEFQKMELFKQIIDKELLLLIEVLDPKNTITDIDKLARELENAFARKEGYEGLCILGENSKNGSM